MTDARELLDAFANRTIGGRNAGPGRTVQTYRLESRAPQVFAALRAVLDEHEWVNIGSAYGKWCKTCTSGPDSTAPAAWPCRTVRAITDALTADGSA